MQIDLNVPMSNFDGAPLQPFRVVIASCLNATGPEVTVEKKEKLFELCERIFSADTVDLNADDVGLIIEASGTMGSPLVVGRVRTLLNSAMVTAPS